MDTIGLDLHKRESQLCIGHADGTLTERRIVTSRERFTAVLGGRPPARVLLEASTESEWVARHLESLGHEVVVADPNYAPMYATRSRRVKTDKRDARTLMEAGRLGAYRPAHRLSEARRHVRAELAVRDAVVRTRTRYVALAKALVRRDGLGVPSSAAERVAAHLQALAMSPALAAELAPLLTLLAPLNAAIAAADQRLSALERTDPLIALLMTAPAIGPVTASAFVATIDDITRFPSAHQLEAYLGLVPRELAAAFVIGGVVMIAVEVWRKRSGRVWRDGLDQVTPLDGLVIGLGQCVAMIPGTSRSMATIVPGQLRGLSTATAAEFSFLLGLPTLGAATLYEGYKARAELMSHAGSVSLLVGLLVSLVVALVVIAGFLHYLKRRGLEPFGYYRIVLGALVFWMALH